MSTSLVPHLRPSLLVFFISYLFLISLKLLLLLLCIFLIQFSLLYSWLSTSNMYVHFVHFVPSARIFFYRFSFLRFVYVCLFSLTISLFLKTLLSSLILSFFVVVFVFMFLSQFFLIVSLLLCFGLLLFTHFIWLHFLNLIFVASDRLLSFFSKHITSSASIHPCISFSLATLVSSLSFLLFVTHCSLLLHRSFRFVSLRPYCALPFLHYAFL